MKKIVLFFLILITGVFLIEKPSISVNKSVAFIDPSLEFEFQLLNTTNVVLSDYEGKQIILDFFATWCVPCKDQETELYKLHDQFPSVTILSISIEPDDSIAVLSEYKTTNNMTWVVGRDFKQQGSNIFSITSIPTLAFIGYSGNLQHHESGVRSVSALSEWITSDEETKVSSSETSSKTTTPSTTTTTTTIFLTKITPGLEFSIPLFCLMSILHLKSQRKKNV